MYIFWTYFGDPANLCQSQQVYIIKSLLARVMANFSGQTVLVCYVVKGPLAAMSRKIKLGTLQGSVITLDVPMTATVRELKMMFLLKHPCQDPLERKVLKVELLRDNSIIDNAESLDEAGLVGAEPPVTVAYARNEVEAVEQDDIHAQGYFGVKIPLRPTLGRVALKGAPLWRASHCQGHWNTFWEYSGTVPWQSSPFLQSRAGNDYGMSG